MHLLSVSVGGWGIYISLITFGIVGILIVVMNLWLLVLLGRIQKMPSSHAKGSWWLININLLEPITTSCWLVSLTLITGDDFYRSLWTISETLWQWGFLTGSLGQSNIEMLLFCLSFYWPMLLSLVIVPMFGLLGRHITRQTARLSLKYGLLRIYGVYIALIAVQEATYFPLLFGVFGLSMYVYRKMYDHAKTILQHPSQAVTIHNQQLAIGSVNPETSQISTIME
ncbi:MAG TPA: hypothetical protein DEF47_23960 [Herpetosiphon sp.]|uniref:Uncharacterized protein n=1 Tax=Herpetosiphon aurantiacus (strain ATCC 23779 / DSM 785 / 114-95) TaxID=316274 RepID=A9AXP9_HERA2|nr:hypothetical protein [Herpetosiphon sp.]ABX03463.1 hypothetical protein Haur_0815 [Herpetosiphon aurantiacus DSM 785]HBW52950.1 hypothetical protein [Herpetosiphon sp.]